MEKLRLYFLAFLVLCFSCGPLASADAGQKAIHFGYLVADQLHEPAPMIMKHLKLLEAEGLSVEWGEYLAGAYLMQHLASGEVDFGTCGAVPTLITKGRGVDVKMLASSNGEGSSIIVKKEIKTVAELDGKSLGTPGIGSIQDSMVDMVARENKIKIWHKHMKVSDMPIFLRKGEIDGFIAWAPHPERAVDLGYGHVLLTSHDILPNHQCCVLVAKGEYVKNDPETTGKVMRAYMKAMEYFQKNPEEVKSWMMKATGLNKNVIEMGLKTVTHPYPPVCDVESMRLMVDGLIKGGKIDKKAVPDIEKFVADSYVPSYLEEYLATKK